MKSSSLPAVLLIGFNRPDCFRQLIEAVRSVKPSRVYVAIDGPRNSPQHASDAERCAETRQLIGAINWPCTLETRVQTTNLGCAQGVSSAIHWFFSHETEGIILEDDCLPAPEFFPYAARMLELYRNDSRVMHINGCNMSAAPDLMGTQSYAFSNLAIIWGWATWRRAWQGYSVNLREADIPARAAFQKPGLSRGHTYGIRSTLLRLARNRFSTWDYQWMLKVLQADGLCPTPRSNLIKNIGFGADATLTTDGTAELASMPYGVPEGNPVEWPHPPVKPHALLNRHLATKCFGASAELTWKMFKNWLRRRRD